ncbi:MAG: CoA pyrophosphatase [Dehalococcoidia bacterium]|nr:MAG: CoA pyrophosphatase [Dehalococcoidia bacterium]
MVGGASLLQQIRDFLTDYRPQRLSHDQAIPAGVLLLIYEKAGEPYVVLTRRTEDVEHHKGETSFPGGAFDPDDGDMLTTALRETEEEIGVRAEDVEVLGQLDDIVTITGFLVSPFVGVLRRWPYPFAANAEEVAELVEVPLGHLMDERNLEEGRQRFGDRWWPILTYNYGDHRIWGATARIFKGFFDHLKEGE